MPALGQANQFGSVASKIVKAFVHAGGTPARGNAQDELVFRIWKKSSPHTRRESAQSNATFRPDAETVLGARPSRSFGSQPAHGIGPPATMLDPSITTGVISIGKTQVAILPWTITCFP